MTVEEIKVEAAKLPSAERVALAEWLVGDHEVFEARHERLRRDIQTGIDQADKGELMEAEEVFDRLRARLRESA